ncbi:MAG: YMGG-like glycine zipper-containing protein [Candidatus Rokuibacteriota bacterium]
MTRRFGYRLGAAALALTVLGGCAGGETTAKGAVVGAGSGAVIGAVAGRGGTGAALGALIGGLLGALVGSEVAHHQTQAVAATPPPAPPPTAVSPPPPPGGQWAVVAPPPSGPPTAAGPTTDPTRGVITNSTPWEVHVYIDLPPGSPGPLVLRPGHSVPVNLDVGKHRIVAQAFVDTQFGRRLVGTFDQILAVDPRAPGWTIRFFEANF